MDPAAPLPCPRWALWWLDVQSFATAGVEEVVGGAVVVVDRAVVADVAEEPGFGDDPHPTDETISSGTTRAPTNRLRLI